MCEITWGILLYILNIYNKNIPRTLAVSVAVDVDVMIEDEEKQQELKEKKKAQKDQKHQYHLRNSCLCYVAKNYNTIFLQRCQFILYMSLC